MYSITIRQVPDQLHKALKEQAQKHHRSLNGEVLATLQDVFLRNGSDNKLNALLKVAEEIREKNPIKTNDREIKKFKRIGLK